MLPGIMILFENQEIVSNFDLCLLLYFVIEHFLLLMSSIGKICEAICRLGYICDYPHRHGDVLTKI